MLMIFAFLGVQMPFSEIKPPAAGSLNAADSDLVAHTKLLGQPSAGFLVSRAVFQGSVEPAARALLTVFLYSHPMAIEQLFWEQAVPFPFTSSLEMRNHRCDFTRIESTPAFKEGEGWKGSPGSADPAAAAPRLTQGFEQQRSKGLVWGLLMLELIKGEGKSLHPSIKLCFCHKTLLQTVLQAPEMSSFDDKAAGELFLLNHLFNLFK